METNEKYIPRIVDKLLEFDLRSAGAIWIKGPKSCGKSTTAEQFARSSVNMQDADTHDLLVLKAKNGPSAFLDNEPPFLIDEWQVAPVLWDAVRTAVDQRQEEGLFILTGSTSVDNSKIMHSGTGRISRMKMYPMSLFESRESTGEISLKTLFNDPALDIDGATSELSIENLIFAACRGGWPGALRRKSDAAKLMIAKDYLNNICESDISTVDGVQRNPVWTNMILRSYARNISTLAKKTNIYRDISANADSMTSVTMDSYLNALEKLFVIEDVDAWCPAIRSATTIRSGKKREFTDPSIAVAALGLTPDYLQTDLKTFGFVFECLCIRDLKVYSQALGGKLSYYHDRYDLEADAVLHLDDGRYALIEFKLGSREIEEGAKHLLQLIELIRKYNEKETQVPLREPDLLMVITGGEMAYTREDGVKIVPIGALRD